MITVFLRGGLGNQMFQYALGLALSKKYETGLMLDTVYLQDRFPRRNFSYRTFDLDVFALDPAVTLLSRAARQVPIPGFWLGLDLGLIGIRSVIGMQSLVKEAGDRFDPGVLEAGPNALLFGSWQSERYFADHSRDVRAAFQFRHPLEGGASDIARHMHRTNSVSLHVRRGDYAIPKYADFYGTTDLGYYDRAVRYVAERVKDPVFFVFSDDIEWCKEHLKIPFQVEYVDRSSEGPKASFHLELMSRAKHHVIANSSFSWWGAWLDPRPEKIVVAPERWFADTERGKDVVPQNWVSL